MVFPYKYKRVNKTPVRKLIMDFEIILKRKKMMHHAHTHVCVCVCKCTQTSKFQSIV